jgi:hypothetical protein
MMSTAQAWELERLQQKLEVSDGQLIAFARQFAAHDCTEQFTLDLLSFEETLTMISQLRMVEESERMEVCCEQ